MSAKIMMVDGTGTRRTAKVTIRGQVVSSPLEYSKFYTAATASNNVAVNVVPPNKAQAVPELYPLMV